MIILIFVNNLRKKTIYKKTVFLPIILKEIINMFENPEIIISNYGFP